MNAVHNISEASDDIDSAIVHDTNLYKKLLQVPRTVYDFI